MSPTSATLSGEPVGASQSTNASGQEEQATGVNHTAPVPEPKLPSRKDVSLAEFTKNLKNVKSIIPEAVVDYQLTKAGINPSTQPPELKALLALAMQKFVADISSDAYQFAKIRQGNSSSNNPMASLGPAAPGAGGAGAAGGAAGKDGGRGAGAGVLGVQRPGYGGGGQGGSQNRTVLTMEDLGMAVGEYGVNVKRGEFYR